MLYSSLQVRNLNQQKNVARSRNCLGGVPHRRDLPMSRKPWPWGPGRRICGRHLRAGANMDGEFDAQRFVWLNGSLRAGNLNQGEVAAVSGSEDPEPPNLPMSRKSWPMAGP